MAGTVKCTECDWDFTFLGDMYQNRRLSIAEMKEYNKKGDMVDTCPECGSLIDRSGLY